MGYRKKKKKGIQKIIKEWIKKEKKNKSRIVIKILLILITINNSIYLKGLNNKKYLNIFYFIFYISFFFFFISISTFIFHILFHNNSSYDIRIKLII